ncbi:DUF2231 domain-containing protein [Devosia sp. XJ19-1]|uniref:DUF2231 domain-containing protein n=1 Tax=Devosia ureilytica TaxID=2952754 RepID=A0A9Q4AQM8_9HYPH|nr:DUF2231 domain-containing protein [Devosia ureilytica]MCP8884457.1 DUF2231 domain-containing protein [Devosia ureilytica]MCP8888065.1 DUF2231 domain-containing protein [Devosia ureilytica]
MTEILRDDEETEIRDEETPPEARANHPNPAIRAVAEKDIGSAIAVAGHPIHAMLVHFPIAFVVATLGVDIFYWWNGELFWLEVGKWAAGAAFGFGVLAAVVGTLELLAVPGIRVRVASWNHAIAAMVMLAIVGANAGMRIYWPEAVLPSGLMLSVLATMAAGFAGWHGGKLVFDHGVGLIISSRQ